MAKLAATFSLITRGSIAVGSAVVARELFLLSHPMADQWDDLPTNGSRQMYVVSDRGWVGKVCCRKGSWTVHTIRTAKSAAFHKAL